MTNSGACPAQVGIGRIIVEGDAVVGQPGQDLSLPQIQQRPHDIASTNGNPGQAPEPGSSLESKQNGLRLVVGLVPGRDPNRADASGLGGKKLVPGRSKRSVLEGQRFGSASNLARDPDPFTTLRAPLRGLT